MAVHQIIGWSHKKGEVNGNHYDFVIIHSVAKQKQTEVQRGMAGIELRGEPFLVEKLAKIQFNGVVPCNIDLEAQATGKGQYRDIVVHIEPVAPPKA